MALQTSYVNFGNGCSLRTLDDYQHRFIFYNNNYGIHAYVIHAYVATLYMHTLLVCKREPMIITDPEDILVTRALRRSM